MKQKASERLIRFELPEGLDTRLINLGYRPLDMRNVQLLDQYRFYTTQRNGGHYFAAVDEQQRPIPLLAMGPYFHERPDADQEVNAQLERESLSVVIGDLQRIAWKRAHPSRWEHVMLRHKFAGAVAIAVAVIAGIVVCIDSASSSLNIFGFVRALLARATKFDGSNLHRLVVVSRIVFVLVVTTIAYWIAFFFDAWRRPVRSIELSKKSYMYQYGPEAVHLIDELEKSVVEAETPIQPPAETPAPPKQELAPWHGYGNFVSYEEIGKRFQLESKRAKRFAEPFSCLIMTIEPLPGQLKNFVDDVEPHVQRECSRVVWHAIREIDSFARYAHNGFVLLLPNTDEKGACVVEQRLKTRVAACDVGGSSIAEIATVRTGISSIAAGMGTDGDELIRQAESSLLAQRTPTPPPDEIGPEPQTDK